ncbi:ATPase, T2SS/T4P/T4SS family [Advenella sp. FME57]
MIVIDMHFEDGTFQSRQYALPAIVGRQKDCQICVRSWRVARQHARLVRRQAGIFVEDMGTLAGTIVNGIRITEYGPLSAADEILIGPCRMLIRDVFIADSAYTRGSASVEYAHGHGRSRSAQVQQQSQHQGNQRRSDLPTDDSLHKPAQHSVDTPVDTPVHDPQNGRSQEPQCGVSVTQPDPVPVQSPTGPQGTPASVSWQPASADCGERQQTDLTHAARDQQWYQQWQMQLHASLLQALDLRRKDVSQMTDSALRLEAAAMLDRILAENRALPADIDRERLKQNVLDEAIGLGPLEPLLADPAITEVMVNRYDELFIEKAGRLTRYNGAFSSEKSVLGVIERIVTPLGRRIDESSPMVDARLKDGSRVNAIIPPVALRGASLTIRKFPHFRPGMQDLLRLGSLDAAMQQFLTLCIRHRKNLIVSGGTGSGKTTLLNILSNCIPEHERIITIEDAAELRLNHEHLVALEARPANLEGKGQVLIRDLVRNALRMRPDRIVVGECRGAEAFDMLAAMNTGHEGSLTTLHANTPRDALARLETMILMAGMDLPLAAVREHIAGSINFIVQQSRLACGRRVITSITEICGLESGVIKSQEIFRFDRKGTGAFMGLGIAPDCFDALRVQGVPIDMQMFSQYTPAISGAHAFMSSDNQLPESQAQLQECSQ